MALSVTRSAHRSPPPAAIVLALAVTVWAGLHGQQDEQRRIYVTVADASGQPITSRPPDAFRVWENGTARPIVSAVRADDAPAVVLIVHGAARSDTQSVRKAITAVVNVLRAANPDTAIALTTDVTTPRLVHITAGAAVLDGAIGRVVTSGPGLILFEAVEDACHTLAKQEKDRRIVIAIANASKNDAETRPALHVGAALKRANASLWALDYTPDFASVNETIRMSEEKARLFTDWSAASGGSYDRVIGTTPLPQAATRLARLVASQYAVTYRRPAGTGQVELRAGVRGDAGERVIGPIWSAR